jgi:hypothetical protein
MLHFLQGVLAMGCGIAGLFFLRFWRESADRLFVFFALAFWILAAHWAALGIWSPSAETRPYFYIPRLIAFALIMIAIIDRNRVRR